MTKHTFKVGDIVTIDGNDAQWMILAPAPKVFDKSLCSCGLSFYGESMHRPKCSAHVRKLGSYWLQCTATGALYRPHGNDVAVHKSELTLISAHALPTRRELLAAELF